MVVVSKKNLDRLEDYGFKKIKCEDGIFWKKRLYKKNILTGGILIDISQDKEFYNVKIFLDRVIKLPSVNQGWNNRVYLVLETDSGIITKAEASEFCLRKLIQMLKRQKDYIKGDLYLTNMNDYWEKIEL